MRLHEMVRAMNAREQRIMAGDLIRDEIAYQGKTQEWAASRMGMAPGTLSRILRGEPGVTELKLRSVEGALGLPRHLLTHVINGDAKRIEAYGDQGISPDLRRSILDGLTRITSGEKEGSRDDRKEQAQ